MRDYIGTFWRARYASNLGEYLVVDRRGDGFVMFELETATFHPAQAPSWGDSLWMHRHYHSEYFDNMTLEPVERLPSCEITTLEGTAQRDPRRATSR